MKSCEHCCSDNEDSASACIRCGSQRFTEQSTPTVSGETEILGLIAGKRNARWRTQVVSLDLDNLTVPMPALPLEMKGPFRVQTPDNANAGKSKTFDSDKNRGAARIRISGDTVTLEHRPSLVIGVVLGAFFALTGLVTCLAFVGLQQSRTTTQPQFLGLLVWSLIFVGATAWVISRCRPKRWSFQLNGIINLRLVRFPGRGGQAGIHFMAACATHAIMNPDGSFTPNYSQVSFVTGTIEAATELAVCLPKATIPIGDSETQQRSRFAGQLIAATPRLWANPVLIGLNTLVFFLMLADHQPARPGMVQQAMDWGANFGPLTLSGQWWRLLTCCFVHFGFMHFALNMCALWWVGKITERLFGNWTYLWIYLGCGIVGSINSLCWHPLITSAGASGAIFGIFGALMAYLVRHRGGIPEGVKAALTKSLAVVLVNNFLQGSSAEIDFAAHCGGFISGLIFGFVAARPLEATNRKAATRKSALLLGGSMVVVAALWMLQLPPLVKVMSQITAKGVGTASADTGAPMSHSEAQGVVDAIKIHAEFRHEGKEQILMQAVADIVSNRLTRIGAMAQSILKCDTEMIVITAGNREAFESAASRIRDNCLSITTNDSALANPVDCWKTKEGNPALDADTALRVTRALPVFFPDTPAFTKITSAAVSYVQATTNLLGFLDAQWGDWHMSAHNTPEFDKPELAAGYQTQQRNYDAADKAASALFLSPKAMATLRHLKLINATNAAAVSAFAGLTRLDKMTPEDAKRLDRASTEAGKKFQHLVKGADPALADCTKSFDFRGVTSLEQYQVKKQLADNACTLLAEASFATVELRQWYRQQLMADGLEAPVVDPFLDRFIPILPQATKQQAQREQFGKALASYVVAVTNLHAFLWINWGQWEVQAGNRVYFSDPNLAADYRQGVTNMAMARTSLATSLRRINAKATDRIPMDTPEPIIQVRDVQNDWPIDLKLGGIFLSKVKSRALINGQMHGIGDDIQGVVLKKIDQQVTFGMERADESIEDKLINRCFRVPRCFQWNEIGWFSIEARGPCFNPERIEIIQPKVGPIPRGPTLGDCHPS